MEKRPSDFSVVSKGYCFLCLDKISPFVDISSSSVTSFQDISRYLKIDMGKVFIQGGPVHPHLMAKVQRARLKVELCEECASMTENISKQCRQLEKLKMEIKSGLGSIHRKLSQAEETGRSGQFRKVVGSELISGMGGWMEILEVLRTETKQKCVSKIKKASPRLQIQRLGTKEIHKRTFRIPKQEADKLPEQISDSRQKIDGIKVEEPVMTSRIDVIAEDDDKQSENSFADDLPHEVEESDSGSMPTEVRHGDDRTGGRMTNHQATEWKWIMNPDTGKYKCRLCTVEFASISGSLHRHYNTVHRQVRFKCQICGKEFRQEPSYKIHYESVHLGVRFQCKVCKKILATKGNLVRHQRKGGCTIGRQTQS